MMKNNIYIDIDNVYKKNINLEILELCASQARKIGSNSHCDDSLSISVTNSEKLKTLNKNILEKTSNRCFIFPNKLNWNEGIEDVKLKTFSIQ